MGLLKHYKIILCYFAEVIVVLLLNDFFYWVFLNMMIRILNTLNDHCIEIADQSHRTELCVNRWRHSLSTQKRLNPEHKYKEHLKNNSLKDIRDLRSHFLKL